MRLRRCVVRRLWSADPARAEPGRGVDQAMLLKPLAENWPTYSGDYREALQRADADQSVERQEPDTGLEHADSARACLRRQAAGRSDSAAASRSMPTIVGGEGTGELNDSGGRSARIVGSVLAVDGVLYATTPD